MPNINLNISQKINIELKKRNKINKKKEIPIVLGTELELMIENLYSGEMLETYLLAINFDINSFFKGQIELCNKFDVSVKAKVNKEYFDKYIILLEKYELTKNPDLFIAILLSYYNELALDSRTTTKLNNTNQRKIKISYTSLYELQFSKLDTSSRVKEDIINLDNKKHLHGKNHSLNRKLVGYKAWSIGEKHNYRLITKLMKNNSILYCAVFHRKSNYNNELCNKIINSTSEFYRCKNNKE